MYMCSPVYVPMDISSKWVAFLIFSYISVSSKSVLSLDFGIIESTDFQNCSSFTSNIPVKRCCCKNKAQNDYCTDTLNITWDLLKQYRIPRKALSKAPELINFEEQNIIEGQLNCRNGDTLRYTLPAWNESNAIQTFSSYFSPDGYLQVSEYAYSAKEYCIESIKPDEITVVACDFSPLCTKDVKNKTNNMKVCLYRCCNYGEVWDISGERLRCASSGVHKWKPEIYFDTSSDEVLSFTRPHDEPVILFSHPRVLVSNCKADHTFHISNLKAEDNNAMNMTKYGTSPFKVLSDGSVWIKPGKFTWIQMEPGEYCIDGFQHGEGTYSQNSGSFLFECKVFESDENMEHQRKYSMSFGIIIFVCLLFLLLTEIVYILLWSKHNIHGWTVFSYITTLVVTYSLLGISHFASSTLEQKGMQGRAKIWTFCGILGVLCHFAFLCTFSWSTVLSFDLFCTFRTLRPTRRNVRSRSHGVKKFLFYCVFAIIVPTFIVSAGVFLDITYSMDRFSDVITPQYGKFVCYVDPQYARVYYVIVPIAVFLGINFLLFCNTAYSVYKVKKSTQLASLSSTKKEADHQTLRLILKLLLVNGVVWIVEIISWYLQTDHNQVGLISFILDVVNIMQAVAIFFLFVFKDDILESLRKKYPCLEGTINVAFKVKYWGRLQQPQENVAPTSTDTTYSIKTNSKMSVSRV